ncbi:MAG: hypothetical protein DMF73_04245 [Acidobacteria bacterium]|nr:MAG: hypothetical protein DMF73_04245 [Acidobacteriota bacterium]
MIEGRKQNRIAKSTEPLTHVDYRDPIDVEVRPGVKKPGRETYNPTLCPAEIEQSTRGFYMLNPTYSI